MIRQLLNFISIVISFSIACCQASNDCIENIKISNSNIENNDVFLEVKTANKDTLRSVFSEDVYKVKEISPQFGGGFPRVLTEKNKQIFQEIYIPNGPSCDTSRQDTIKSLFFKIPQSDTSWVSFKMKYSSCYGLQLLGRYHYKNRLMLTRNNIILEQELVTNDSYKNIYTVSKKDTNLVKIQYLRNGSTFTFTPKKCSREMFLRILRSHR